MDNLLMTDIEEFQLKAKQINTQVDHINMLIKVFITLLKCQLNQRAPACFLHGTDLLFKSNKVKFHNLKTFFKVLVLIAFVLENLLLRHIRGTSC